MSRISTFLAGLFVIFAAYLLLRPNDDPHLVSTDPSATQMTKEITAVNAPNFHDWREFNSSHFKILLPNLPQHATDVVVDPKTLESHKYETYAAASDKGAAFMVNAITLSDEKKVDEESLKAIVSDILERNQDNKLNQMKMGSFQGKPALDFSLTNGDVLIEGKVFAHGHTMYVLSMIDKKDVFNRNEFDFFMNSFDLFEEPAESSKKTQNSQ